MSHRWRPWPDTLWGQMIAVILCAVVAIALGGNSAERFVEGLRGGIDGTEEITSRIDTVAALFARADPQGRDAIRQSAEALDLPFSVLTPQDLLERSLPLEQGTGIFRHWYHSDVDDSDFSFPHRLLDLGGRKLLALEIDTRTELVFDAPAPSVLTTERIYYSLAMMLLFAGFTAFAVFGVVGPIRRMAAALQGTDRFLAGDAPVQPSGARELRALATALNDMRGRVRGMLASRNRMLRGISHDLRTPLTRLRLRLEQSDDPALCEQGVADVVRIDDMIAATLRYLRDGGDDLELEICDMSSLLQTICAEFRDLGVQITYKGPDYLTALVAVNEIMRALTNVCQNAAAYGSIVHVTLGQMSGAIQIEVRDDGPGIPPELRDRVLEPFFKVDSARASGEGFGLGLAIATEIVVRHGGTLALLDNLPRGLVVSISLPQRAA